MGVVSRLSGSVSPSMVMMIRGRRKLIMMMRARLGMMRLKWVLALLTGHLVKWLLR